jgi:NAD(P)-dependent dehydrogenase (short-subunit alcohol dehydrogenase family)
MPVPLPSFTTQWHTTSYPSISPTRPELSLSGKFILISGGGTGIGAATALSYARAGASHIALLGRRLSKLESTASSIRSTCPNTTIHTYAADMTDAGAVNSAFEDYAKVAGGKIDILVSNAATGDFGPSIKDIDADAWLSDVSTNISGPFHLTRAFLVHGKSDGLIINVTSGFSFLFGASVSAYAVSKEACVRFFQIVGAENEGLRCVSVHPGIVETDMNKRSAMAAEDDGRSKSDLLLSCRGLLGLEVELTISTVSLPADFLVWVASEEAAFLKGKYVWANWDVGELLEKKQEIGEGKLLEMWLNGVPFEARA